MHEFAPGRRVFLCRTCGISICKERKRGALGHGKGTQVGDDDGRVSISSSIGNASKYQEIKQRLKINLIKIRLER
jgi:hypothetical protein